MLNLTLLYSQGSSYSSLFCSFLDSFILGFTLFVNALCFIRLNVIIGVQYRIISIDTVHSLVLVVVERGES